MHTLLFYRNRAKVFPQEWLSEAIHRILRKFSLRSLFIGIYAFHRFAVLFSFSFSSLPPLQLGGPQNRSLVMCRYNKRGVLTNIITGLQNIRRALPSFIKMDSQHPCVPRSTAGAYYQQFWRRPYPEQSSSENSNQTCFNPFPSDEPLLICNELNAANCVGLYFRHILYYSVIIHSNPKYSYSYCYS